MRKSVNISEKEYELMAPMLTPWPSYKSNLGAFSKIYLE